MSKLLHRLLYRLLPLKWYLWSVSRLFFLCYGLGWGRKKRSMEYVYHLPNLVQKGDTAIDIGANLGYYSRPLSQIVGNEGRVYSVEPVPVIFEVLKRNMHRRANATLLNYALGEESGCVDMVNDTVTEAGYFGTGRNAVSDGQSSADAIHFTVQMRRGSELFADLERLDFIKCDIEGYERIVLPEMRALIERFHPVVLLETDGDTRREMVAMFADMGYRAYTLSDDGSECPLTTDSDRDIIFRY